MYARRQPTSSGHTLSATLRDWGHDQGTGCTARSDPEIRISTLFLTMGSGRHSYVIDPVGRVAGRPANVRQ